MSEPVCCNSKIFRNWESSGQKAKYSRCKDADVLTDVAPLNLLKKEVIATSVRRPQRSASSLRREGGRCNIDEVVRELWSFATFSANFERSKII
jgi:hypothetical protein